ncbi:MAG: DUF1287 domain-containing protein [Hyphomicrobiales bacterium]|nr:DUF1287 domain-containing protein [Hyphomicrobiales bacterium]
MISRRFLNAGLFVAASGALVWRSPVSLAGNQVFAQSEPWAQKLVSAAIGQIGRTTIYDPAYVGLSYPMGDVPMERGVCSDVLIRAYRDAFGIDLQQLVHEDMRRNFSRYPKRWGLKRPDRNIDHRRVLNLEVYFERRKARLDVTNRAEDYKPGDIVSQMLPGNLPHMAIVSHHASPDGRRPMVVHNIGAGTRLEDSLFAYQITGHFRFSPASPA